MLLDIGSAVAEQQPWLALKDRWSLLCRWALALRSVPISFFRILFFFRFFPHHPIDFFWCPSDILKIKKTENLRLKVVLKRKKKNGGKKSYKIIGSSGGTASSILLTKEDGKGYIVKGKETERMPSSLGTFPRTWDESQEEGTCLFITRPPHYFPRPSNIIIIIMRSTISTITMPLLALFANRFIVAQHIGLYIRPPEACVLYIKE